MKKSGEPYKKDDLVMLQMKAIPVGEPKKFYKEWSGPWRVVTVISDVDSRIQYIGNIADIKRRLGRISKKK